MPLITVYQVPGVRRAPLVRTSHDQDAAAHKFMAHPWFLRRAETAPYEERVTRLYIPQQPVPIAISSIVSNKHPKIETRLEAAKQRWLSSEVRLTNWQKAQLIANIPGRAPECK